MWSKEVIQMIAEGVWQTLLMTVVSTVFGYLIGLPMGVHWL